MKKPILKPMLPLLLCLSFLIFSSFLILFGCAEETPVTPPPPYHPDYRKINLSVEDVSCTEVWIKISADSIPLPAPFTIDFNGQTGSINFNSDTVLYFSGLQKAEVYHVAAYLNKDTSVSNDVEFTTLNTSSSGFTWEVLEFGTSLTSYSDFYDATIINENDIWVAGEVRIADSSKDDVLHGAAHWDGTKWTLLVVPYRVSQYSNVYWPGELRSIINFGSDAVYATGGGGTLIKWNGKKWEEKIVEWGPQIRKLWGSDEENIYGAADDGKVYKTSGSKWVELPQLTSTGLTDITGTPDGKKVWVCGFKNWNGDESIIIEYEAGKGKILWEKPDYPIPAKPYYINSVWSTKNRLYAAGGRNVFYKLHTSDSLYQSPRLPWFPFSVGGSGYNNIFAVGDMGMIWHFDGDQWRRMNDNPYLSSFLKVAAKDNIVVAVGSTDENFPPRALIYMGRR